jgi:hypothetical protein
MFSPGYGERRQQVSTVDPNLIYNAHCLCCISSSSKPLKFKTGAIANTFNNGADIPFGCIIRQQEGQERHD